MEWIAKVFQGKQEMVMADPKDVYKVMHAAMQICLRKGKEKSNLQVNGGPL